MTATGGPRPANSPVRPLAGLLEALEATGMPARSVGDVVGVAVRGITHDSRAVRPGDLYAALPGARTHGLAHVDAARAAGAVAVLSDAADPGELPAIVVPDPRRALGPAAAWVYGEPSRRLRLVGITGTNGKTTSAYLVEAALRHAGRATGLIGTVETRIGSQALDGAAPTTHTTPEATDLQGLLAAMVEHRVTDVAMEVSSHGLALRRVDATRFAVAVFTNLSQDHLDLHGDMQAYYAAKARLFTREFTDVAVVNIDDPAGLALAETAAAAGARVVTTSATGAESATWRASDVQASRAGTTCRVRGPEVDQMLKLQLIGVFNVANALGALAAAVEVGVPADVAAAGLETLAGVPGRLEAVAPGAEFLAVVDYAHTPDAVTSLLTTLRPLTPGRLVLVLGCGGDRDRAKRPLMGAAAARGADLAILTSDNPRSEDPVAIVEAMRAGTVGAPAEVIVELDRARAIALAVQVVRAGDTVVVAGKGHERHQVLADRTIPFDDREVLRKHIDELAPAQGAP